MEEKQITADVSKIVVERRTVTRCVAARRKQENGPDSGFYFSLSHMTSSRVRSVLQVSIDDCDLYHYSWRDNIVCLHVNWNRDRRVACRFNVSVVRRRIL